MSNLLGFSSYRFFGGAYQLARAEDQQYFGYAFYALTDDPRQQPRVVWFAASAAVEQEQPVGGKEGLDRQSIYRPRDYNARQGELVFIENEAVDSSRQRAAYCEAREIGSRRHQQKRDDIAQRAHEQRGKGSEHCAGNGYRQKRAAYFYRVAEKRQRSVGEHSEHYAKREQHCDEREGLNTFKF